MFDLAELSLWDQALAALAVGVPVAMAIAAAAKPESAAPAGTTAEPATCPFVRESAAA